jgi:hypothetical protein
MKKASLSGWPWWFKATLRLYPGGTVARGTAQQIPFGNDREKSKGKSNCKGKGKDLIAPPQMKTPPGKRGFFDSILRIPTSKSGSAKPGKNFFSIRFMELQVDFHSAALDKNSDANERRPYGDSGGLAFPPR